MGGRRWRTGWRSWPAPKVSDPPRQFCHPLAGVFAKAGYPVWLKVRR
jgi:hypothetical protein